jgi:hypothetical protein
MECLAAFFVLSILLFVMLGTVGERMYGRRRRRRLFRDLAKHFKGAYDAGGLFSRPALRLRYGETWAVVTQSHAGGPFFGRSLQVRIAWPHPNVRCEIIATPEPRLLRGLRHAWLLIEMDGTDFGERYIVTGAEESVVRPLLTDGVQWQIDRLRKLVPDERLYVLIRDGQLIVQRPWQNLRLEPTVAFIQMALELFDQCMLARASGIEFLNTDEAQSLDRIECKVCGESIASDLVFCRRCKTPHHQECWQYVGVCSVYGCRETVYLVPQQGTGMSGES